MNYNQQQGDQIQKRKEIIRFIKEKTKEEETNKMLNIIYEQMRTELLKADWLPF